MAEGEPPAASKDSSFAQYSKLNPETMQPEMRYPQASKPDHHESMLEAALGREDLPSYVGDHSRSILSRLIREVKLPDGFIEEEPVSTLYTSPSTLEDLDFAQEYESPMEDPSAFPSAHRPIEEDDFPSAH